MEYLTGVAVNFLAYPGTYVALVTGWLVTSGFETVANAGRRFLRRADGFIKERF